MATKVFVGNLSFQTSEEQLREAFVPSGNVVTVNIIKRGPRSLGYGFVELASESEADKAVEAMDQKTLDGRVVNVQIARPQVKREEGEGSSSEGKRRPGARRRRTDSGSESNAPTGGAGSNAAGARRPAPGGPRRTYRPRGEKTEGGGSGDEGRPGQRRGGGAPRRAPQTGGGASSTTGAPIAARRPRKIIPRKPREASTTTLFVGNLPFSMEDAGLLELFSAHKPVKATIAKKVSGRSKGFGFVEFGAEEAQKAALEAMKDQQVEGRDLNLKVALQPVEREQEESHGNTSGEGQTSEESEAPASEKKAETKQEASTSETAAQ